MVHRGELAEHVVMLICEVIGNVGFACVEAEVFDLGDAGWDWEVSVDSLFILHQSNRI